MYNDLINNDQVIYQFTKQYEVPLSRMLHDILDDYHIQ